MIPILLPSLALITGIVGLLLGADKFVAGAAAAARNFGISAMVIGLTVVSIGTSAPEIIVSFNAALDGAGRRVRVLFLQVAAARARRGQWG